jgi:putative ABC transport system permease protein
VSAILPGLEASRVQPLAAMRASTLVETARRWLPRTAGAGVACAAVGAAVLVGIPGSIEASFAGLFGVVLGIALAVPLLTVGAMGLAAPVAARVAGPLGRLAARTVTRGVSRTGVAIAALTVAVSVTIGVSVMIDSFRDTVSNWLDLTLRADLYVSAPSPGARRSGTLPRDVPDRIASQPGVAEVETYRAVRVFSEVGEIQLGVTDSPRARSGDLYRFTEGDPARAWRRFGEGAVVVSEPFAFRHGLPSSGGRIEILTDRGPRVFPVAGVFYDYTTEQGVVLMSRSSYERWWDDRGVTSVAAYLDPGASTEEVAAGLRRSLSEHGLGVVSNRALRENALRVFDRTFAVTQALRALAVIVAFAGVWSALMALQVERTRELATLSAVGVTPGELLGLTLLETGLMGLTAGLIALPTGVLLAVILVDVINVRSFGWTMELQLAPGVFVQALAVSVVAALLAALYPLRRLSRLPVAAALRTE